MFKVRKCKLNSFLLKMAIIEITNMNEILSLSAIKVTTIGIDKIKYKFSFFSKYSKNKILALRYQILLRII